MQQPTVKVNNKLVNLTMTFVNTTDGDGMVYCQDLFYKVEVKAQQQQIRILFPDGERDREYTKIVFSSTLDCCKIVKGIRTNPIIKVFMENFVGSASDNFNCPFVPNQNYKISNMTCTDNKLPPLPIELRFKLETIVSGLVKGMRGWQPLFSVAFYGKVKK